MVFRSISNGWSGISGRKGIKIMKIREIQEEILRLKKERDFCILAHSYQTSDILEIADFTGDSYALSVKAKNTPQKNVLMCGVRFMAETVKILSPEKNVYLSNPTAGCPMAEQMDKEMIRAVKKIGRASCRERV